MEKYINLKNKQFGRLTVIKKSEKPQGVKSAYAYWLCKCECGNEIVASSSSLRRGHTRSCGCLAKDLLTSHGQSKTGIYRRWYGMRQRCNNPKDISYPNYGGRGIRVCEEWDTDFQSFYTWAIADGFSSELQLDRIDTNGNYEPSNCRWVKRQTNMRNKRNNIVVQIDSNVKTLSEWAECSGIPYKTLFMRYQNGWRGKKLISPLRQKTGK